MSLRCHISNVRSFLFSHPALLFEDASSLFVFIFLFLIPWLSFLPLSCPFLLFLPLLFMSISCSLSFSSFFPSALWPQGGEGGGYLITLSYTLVHPAADKRTHAHSLTQTHTVLRLEGWSSLIETNGEITQTAVLNNSLHSHLSGAKVRKLEAGGGLCCDQ